jgi:hypothetical protein
MSHVTDAGRAPVNARSRFRRLPGRPYTEVAGQPVVVNLERRMCVPLSPAAVALWAALDGRPLHDLVAAADLLPACIELLRRWRAFGLIEEDAVLDDAPAPHPVAAPARRATVTLRAHVAASGSVLLVGPDRTERTTVAVDPPRVVGAEQPLVGLVGLAAPTAPGPRLDALGVFAVLVAGLDHHDEHDGPEALVDALATLAESLTGRAVTAVDPADAEVRRAVAELAR